MKRIIKRPIVGLLVAVLTLMSPLALATNITATVSTNKVVKNQVFQLRVVVDSKVSSDALDLSGLEKDFYVGRPSFGSSMNFINGKRSNSSEWNISLAAQRLGIATIPSFTVDGATSQPITIQVSVDNDQPQVRDLVELHSSLSKTTLYPKESTQLTTRLIVKADPRRLQNPNIIAPRSQGIVLEPMGEPNQYQAVVDGVEVTVVDQNYRVTAQQSGQFTVSGIGFTGSVVFGDNRTGTTKLVSANTPAEEFQIIVQPIPSEYQGQWLPAAALTLSQQWRDSNGQNIDPSQPFTTSVGESLTREIYLDIEGLSSEQFPDLKVNYPDSVRVYQEKPQFSDLGDGKTRMTLKQVLIAQQQGQIELSQIELNWWDSSNHHQAKASLEGLQLFVNPADQVNNEPISAPTVSSPQSKTITIYQAGIWPYLTALFALLWLATLVLWNRARHADIPDNTESVASPTEDKLKAALAVDDRLQANFLLNCWLEEHPQINAEIRQQIEQQRSMMNQSSYSQSEQSWQATELLSLLKKARKSKTSRSNKTSQLASL
ncbi:BatD family protein [Vibrio sp. M250220]|uniref:BatD family protein n=1 Tax=Vibrio sp. M250220 TaxID=3020894 RepID=UPI002F414064